MLKVCLVLKRGGDYSRRDVDKVRSTLAAHLTVEHHLMLLTDDAPEANGDVPLLFGWPGWWSKMELFRPDISGDMFYLDLDTVICGNIDALATVGKTTMLSDFYFPDNPASGLMYLTEVDRRLVWERWVSSPTEAMRRNRGDQDFIGAVIGSTAKRWQSLYPGHVVSYKCHVRRKSGPRETGNGSIPQGVKIVCFHGRPRPQDVAWLQDLT